MEEKEDQWWEPVGRGREEELMQWEKPGRGRAVGGVVIGARRSNGRKQKKERYKDEEEEGKETTGSGVAVGGICRRMKRRKWPRRSTSVWTLWSNSRPWCSSRWRCVCAVGLWLNFHAGKGGGGGGGGEEDLSLKD